MYRPLCVTILSAVFVTGCSDPTYKHREALAIGLTKAIAWQHPDLNSVATELQRMHLGAGQAAATAEVLEQCLDSSPPFDDELLSLIRTFAESSRKLEAQFRQAISDGRPELSQEEQEIAIACGKANFILFGEILERIKYNELVESE